MSCIWITINIYYNKLQKTWLQNSFIRKNVFSKKGEVILFFNNHIDSLYIVCTHVFEVNFFQSMIIEMLFNNKIQIIFF
jgi:hypothetical protein